MAGIIFSLRKSLTVLAFIFSFNSYGQSSGFDPQGPRDNSIFPEFDYVTVDGDSISSDELADKIVVVDIWFVGCSGCRQEEPYLKKVTESYQGNENIVFLGFCMSSPDKIKRYHEKFGEIGYTNVSLSREEVEETYGVRLLPTHFFIKNGVLQSKYTGPIIPEKKSLQWFEEEIRKLEN